MALPTLRPHYISRRSKPQAEQHIVRQRNREADFKQQWEENSRYFSNSDMRSSKQETWTSSQCFMDSMAAYESQGRSEEKKKRLVERRERLASLLSGERDMYEREFKESASGKLGHMKHRADHLKTQRIEQDKVVAEEKLEEYRRANCPELREVESRQMQRVVQGEWKEQIGRREREIESARREKEEYDLAMENERLAALKLEDDLKARKKMTEQDYVQSLQQQMAEVRAREEEASLLEKQHSALVLEQMELDKAEEERARLEDARKKMDFGRVLLKQHKAQMRRKSRQIQEALELDLRILEELTVKEQDNMSVQTARKEKALADVQWMKQVVAEQIELEKRREEELELLYQEEAARMWQKREGEWEGERLARNRLMTEVLAERQQQIGVKMEAVKERQAESIQRREELLRDMEMASQKTEQETYLREREKAQRQEELEQQVIERRKQASQGMRLDMMELERQREIDDNYDHYVREEGGKLSTQRYSPKFHGRKKHTWY